jgi:hypothetical protein
VTLTVNQSEFGFATKIQRKRDAVIERCSITIQAAIGETSGQIGKRIDNKSIAEPNVER